MRGMLVLPPLNQETALLIHSSIEAFALLLGAWLYRRNLRQQANAGLFEPTRLAIAAGCLFGAGIGNKAAFWLDRPDLFAQHVVDLVSFLQAGQSVIGGLMGGLIGVEIAKLITRQTRSTGDLFVAPILLGLLIGRIGCFLAGLHDETYGLPTSLPWGVDFGDGLARHPTQLYDMLFAALGLLLHRRYAPRLIHKPGLQFRLLLISYLSWRLLIDLLKPVAHAYPLGLSGLQWLCILFLLIYIPLTVRKRYLPNVT